MGFHRLFTLPPLAGLPTASYMLNLMPIIPA